MALYIGMIPDFTSTDFKYSGFVKANILYLTIFFIYLYKTQIHFYYQNHKKIALNTLIALSILLFLGSRTTLLAIAIVLIINYSKTLIQLITKKTFIIVVFSGFIILNYTTPLISRTWANLQDSFDLTSHYIRGIMLHLSILIAKDYFPIGTGSATFGTVFSEGSVVYDFYNQGWRSYFTKMVGIFDSNFASVLGEFGVIGIILFAIIIIVMLKKLKILINKKMYYVLAFLLWFNFFFRGLFMSSDLTFLILLSFFFIIYNYEKNINSNKYVS
ncbi:O-antigen ligase family protein [Lacinutrix iliipiscaria]|uniref:O-antigen ligase family protein n=1 Tax=Lacinutrix iliipiscaria TaxID=1230532 RepID=A0ABW5WKY3_9FLAO